MTQVQITNEEAVIRLTAKVVEYEARADLLKESNPQFAGFYRHHAVSLRAKIERFRVRLYKELGVANW